MYVQTKRNLGVHLRDFKPGAPKEIRTPVLALRGPRPRPLDDGGNSAQILPPPTGFVNSPDLRKFAQNSGFSTSIML